MNYVELLEKKINNALCYIGCFFRYVISVTLTQLIVALKGRTYEAVKLFVAGGHNYLHALAWTLCVWALETSLITEQGRERDIIISLIFGLNIKKIYSHYTLILFEDSIL